MTDDGINLECVRCGKFTGGQTLCKACSEETEARYFVITVENAGKVFAMLILLAALGVFVFLLWAMEHATR